MFENADLQAPRRQLVDLTTMVGPPSSSTSSSSATPTTASFWLNRRNRQ
jgi:hypothetical protein